MRALVASDFHLVYSGTNTAAVEAFLELARTEQPDLVVLNGDIYELWRNDIGGAMHRASGFTSAMWDVQTNGTEVVYLVGNHDDWFHRNWVRDDRYPFEPRQWYSFESGGERFRCIHSHQFEPSYAPFINDALHITNDWIGEAASRVWSVVGRLPGASELLVTTNPTAASYVDPELTARSPSPRYTYLRFAMAMFSGNAWGLYGHTHRPFVDAENQLANSGSMTGDRGTYLEVDDGRVELRSI